ncbi:endolytic transglycosylase MltG [Altericroceibacterium endophyticum]|uniref:Endolytic murein transglycosylase n=1 Tax=Altericroceibacterium endophyticum TaxID=1808508 RepID=A0A6I4T492_9SPHN|nr:endolytic transglycosylase MltG [Altericroceibacterium endophyticum]MXO64883.1 endolytic transglycosylase MltG [Altericroceibacterium endophyticum]
MIRRGVVFLILAGMAVVLIGAAIFASGWWGSANLEKDRAFLVSSGSSLTAVAQKLEEEGIIDSADGFLTRAKIFAGDDPIKAGEFMLPAGASPATILDTFQHGDVVRRFVTIPEGMPSIMVYERLMAEPLLTGKIDVPAEGSVLPESYDFERGESRADVLARMQQAMTDTVAELWQGRAKNIAVDTPQEAVTLASIVEKETALPKERRMVAGLYSNRVKKGMMLQADPTIIYPITKGKPLGRRIRQSEIAAINDYNTYSMVGLPKGPITNPGRASIAAVLNPAETDAIYMVADGTGGHVFSKTLDEHNRNVEKWFAIRRKRGEI